MDDPHFTLYVLVGLAVVVGGGALAGKIQNRLIRALCRSGFVAFFVSPTMLAGHGGPALLLWVAGSGFNVLRYCMLPTATGWVVFFAIGLCFSWFARTRPEK